MTAYLDESRPFPYCAGCGHPHVLRALDAALQARKLAPRRVPIVTDIGCVGLADPFFPGLDTVHSLHGRSVAVAVGLALARSATEPVRPVVLIGDGGAGIGLLHLVHAAQLNAPVTVIVHNNLIYGMTGGQHSSLTPPGLRTTTTPQGAELPPLDLGAILAGAHAGFFARATAPSPELGPLLERALTHPGFACVEVFELCPTFVTLRGGLKGKDVADLPARLGLGLGLLLEDTARPAFGAGSGRAPGGIPEDALTGIERQGLGGERSTLARTVRLVLAGRAGERVQSAAQLAAQAALASGLHVTLRTDNPVTQGTGFSLAELTIAPEPVAYTGLENPDLVVATATEGLKEVQARGLLQAGAAQRIVFDAELSVPDGASGERLALRSRFGGKSAALGALAAEAARADWWPRAGWELALETQPEERRRELRAILALT